MTLDDFIASNPDPRELKRALAVKMRLEGMKHKQIQAKRNLNAVYGMLLTTLSRNMTCFIALSKVIMRCSNKLG